MSSSNLTPLTHQPKSFTSNASISSSKSSLNKSVKLCHICGSNFPSTSIAVHQSRCMKKTMSKSSFALNGSRQSLAISTSMLKLDLSPKRKPNEDAPFTSTPIRQSVGPRRSLSDVPTRDDPEDTYYSTLAQDPYISARKAPEAAESTSAFLPTKKTVIPSRKNSTQSLKEVPRSASNGMPPSRLNSKSSSMTELENEREELADSHYEYRQEEQQEFKEEPLPGVYSSVAMAEGIVEDENEIGDRLPCPLCSRKFAGEERLEKHVAACSKMKKPRKVFDTTKARVKGTELEQYALKKTFEGSNGSGAKGKNTHENTPIKPKKANWRVKHENFIRMVRANRGPANGEKGDFQPVISEPDPDYVLCEHCNRRFNETAAERHIPICAQTKHRSMLKHPARGGGAGVSLGSGSGAGADEALRKRMSFKPPPPKVKKPLGGSTGSLASAGSSSASSSPRRR
ncbi:hypothetical protein HDV05_008281 [Chytridiales sp. JEL 0842]|nr:hypothetical protein HDV05_008281 [Chytridiales sp. JEL 0842]